MGRYRAPRPPSSNYISPEGAADLRAELDFLWRTKRPAVTAAVAEAAAQGDRSENAEYVYGKRQLAEIDRRIRYLRKRLDACIVVSKLPSDRSRVFFGAWFELRDAARALAMYRLVGADEVGTRSDYVSVDSPLGKAVLGKRVAEEVTVRTPEGLATYRLESVRYEEAVAAKKSPA